MMDGNWADPDVLECESQKFLQILSEVTSKQPCSYKKKHFTNQYKYIYIYITCSGHWNMVDTAQS